MALMLALDENPELCIFTIFSRSSYLLVVLTDKSLNILDVELGSQY